ncbi:MAG: 4-hydroxyphenylpyruvate dioxygenase [Deltaproteobacteria bacterium]|nr:4-hydroxyphenylpyruvate dioxygenase [Deltaproteobacteria bacterium]
MDERKPLGARRIHHVELWVGNAMQAAHYYRKTFGFSQLAYAGLETGNREQASYVLGQGNVRFVVSSPLSDQGPMGHHLVRHGDGVRDVAFEVADVDAAYALAVDRGALGLSEPQDWADDHGKVRRAAIQAYGDTIHTFLSKGAYDGPFLPGFTERRIEEPDAGLLAIDHVVANVEEGKMNEWADWYSEIFGFQRYISFDDKDISTEYSALRSVVMSDDERRIKLPINEPAAGKGRSQIQEYLDFYRSPGVQHVALLTADVIATVRRLVDNDCQFLMVPDSYYETLSERVGPLDEPMDELRRLGILVDRDDRGYLLQLFTKPVEDRPTLFFEIIQRKGARGFGKGNFKALFESIEREQERRGTL